MPKNTPKVNRHPKTRARLNNPPKINHKEEKIRQNKRAKKERRRKVC